MIDKLSARERQLFEALYAAKEATAAQLRDALDDAPGNSAVRVMLRRLEAKGFITHREAGGRFIYAPSIPEKRIEQSALQRFVETYFGGSAIGAAAALVGMTEKVDPEELHELEQVIAKVRREEGQ